MKKGDLTKQHKEAAAKVSAKAAAPAVKVDAKPAAFLTSLSRGRTIDRGQF